MQFEVNTEALQSCSEQISTFKDILTRSAEEIGSIRSNLSNSSASFAAIKLVLAMNQQLISSLANKEAQLARILAEIAEAYVSTEVTLTGDGSYNFEIAIDSILNPYKEKENFIDEFEKSHPEIAKKVDKLLKQMEKYLSESDIRNIKYLIYHAEEPYRSIFIKNLSNFHIKNMELGDSQAYYKPWLHTLNYTYPDSFGNDPRGQYTTFFHETGHAIDDLSNETKWLGADTNNYKAYSDAMGKEVTIRDAILYDVYQNNNNPHSVTSIANRVIANGKASPNANVQNVINAMQNGDSNKLSNADLKLYNQVIKEFKNDLSTTNSNHAKYESVSDVYGGVSQNELRNGYGHDTSYWNNKSSAASELWAEYFSYNMSGNTENLSSLREYFPEASKILDSYANDLVN